MVITEGLHTMYGGLKNVTDSEEDIYPRSLFGSACCSSEGELCKLYKREIKLPSEMETKCKEIDFSVTWPTISGLAERENNKCKFINSKPALFQF